jgi:asparagine synthetase B (glutamine-hydrolysing)
VALFLSAGIDSRALLFGLLELKKNVHIYTFRLDGVYSRDFRISKELAEFYNLEFTEVILPNDIHTLKKDLLYLINDLKLKKKTDIECTWAMLYAIKMVKEKYIVAGLGADGHFVISKKGMIHYRDSIEHMNQFREQLFSNPNYAQMQTLTHICKDYNKIIVSPFLDDGVVELFKDTSWEEINTTKQKQIILDMYASEFAKNKFFEHTNFQKGDSGISEHFEKLLDTNWKVGKGVVSIYNAIRNKKITKNNI